MGMRTQKMTQSCFDTDIKTVVERSRSQALTEYLKERSDKINLLYDYSVWLEKQGYLDTDWREENAIDEYLK